jgi:hypothetical protein
MTVLLVTKPPESPVGSTIRTPGSALGMGLPDEGLVVQSKATGGGF